MTAGRLSSLIATCGLVLPLAACASPSLHAPVAIELPEVWRAPLPHNGSMVALADSWKAFPDPMLVKLIERAQAANPNLQVAAALSGTSGVRLARKAAFEKDP
ncbi:MULTISPECIES: hypothetical protein [Variovorax]|uniref:hypothetical protein n=1 Tax=Variovorax TaxID=34072 RepID=UPI00286300EF|nr:hypothetical protein [Variovorax sp. 3319]MDR6890936.1 outer membrane protein TolC [Variovorax sp. 3319]